MPSIQTQEAADRALESAYGFLSKDALQAVAQVYPSRLVLIRWHEGRALAPADQAAGLIEAAERGGWTVRDVCARHNVRVIPDEAPGRPWPGFGQDWR